MSVAKKVVFSLIPTILVLAALEGGARVMFSAELSAWDAPPPAEGGQTPTMPGNPYLIYEYRPGKHIQAGEMVTINSMGMRGEEPTIPKPAGVRRLLTTGDSSIFGFGVADEHVFSEVAARALGDNVEAINAATPGYSSFQTINLLKLRALETEPDVVVIGNLWSDNNFDAFVDKELLATYNAYATGAAGQLRGLLATSALFRVLDYRGRVKEAAENVKWGDAERMFDKGEHIGLRRVEINDYAQNLQTIVDLAESVGSEVLFLLPANNEDLDTSNQNQKAWDPYRWVMRDTASRNGAPVIDVPALFTESGKTREDLFVDEMHPSVTGHAIIGDALAALLAEADWASGGDVMHNGTGGPMPSYEDPFVGGSVTNGNAPAPGGGDPGPNPGGGDPGPNPDGGDPGPNPDGGGPNLGPTIEGELTFSGYTQGIIQIDVFPADEAGSSNPQMLGTDRLQSPGAFRVQFGSADRVVFRAYHDADSDGPDADDRLFDMTTTVISVEDARAGKVVINLDDEKINIQG